MNNKKLYLIYGPNGVGKTSIARYLATKNNGLHIQIDWFSSMQRGKVWYTRKNNKDKVNIIIGALDAIFNKTSYKKVYLEGVLIYKFMFDVIKIWCIKNNIELMSIKLIGKESIFKKRIIFRKKKIKNINKILPQIYKNFSYKNSKVIDIGNFQITEIAKKIDKIN